MLLRNIPRGGTCKALRTAEAGHGRLKAKNLSVFESLDG